MIKYLITSVGLSCLLAVSVRAETKVTVESHSKDEATAAFVFKSVPRPSATDAATAAKFSIVDGEEDANGGDLEKLHDGKLPDEEDQPGENFFFAAGSEGGRLQVDLGHAIDVRQINTYSWHPSARGPQVYKLYAADGAETNFNTSPKFGTAPDSCGWKLVANVNTKPKADDVGGQYGVSIANSDGMLGKFRYLLFDIAATEREDDFGNTFYSEIDVVDAAAPVVSVAAAPPEDFIVKTSDGKCTITINSAKAPALKEWAETKLAPALAEWYPKIVAELPSKDFSAPEHFKVTLKPMDGVAFTSGQEVVANSNWLEKELDGEAVGSLIHEAVHVVQRYGYGSDKPGWMVEGIPDYIRWFQYEPQSHGADNVWLQKHRKNFSPKYTDSYRISANFLDWVARKYDKDIVTQMNAALRDGTYENGLWKNFTGKTADELGVEWKQEVTALISSK